MMPRQIDLVRASKLPSNMMQFAARGALSVPLEESIEILVYLAKHNKVFGDLARMTLAGWDEKSSLAAASNPDTPREVLDYLISPDNVRPKLLPALLENPSIPDSLLAKFAISASRESIAMMLQSARVQASTAVLNALRSNPYLRAEDAATIAKWLQAGLGGTATAPVPPGGAAATLAPIENPGGGAVAEPEQTAQASGDEAGHEVPDEAVTAYLAEHAPEIDAEKDKPFQPVGGIVELLGTDYFPVSENKDMAPAANLAPPAAVSASGPAAASKPAVAQPNRNLPAKRDNSVQKINRLDVKGRIQLAMKGNKEERSILIRDGTKVVALAVLDAPKLSDGEVEKFALQKNVLEAVLRQIPLKRRFMKNYIVVRNLVANPRTPLDLGLGLMKHLLPQDLKNISGNKEISETVRKLALKMYKQKLDAAAKK
ncbi:MAG: hypothetical protein ABSF59_12210 [Candidatus Sulfotelmatobacter sp.]|jgi:hypothetical protein